MPVRQNMGFLDAKIYVVHYKPGKILKNDQLYQPLMSGNFFCQTEQDMIGDDTGDHISEKNRYYSELSGIYWIWKNRHHQVTGLCHYRRYYTVHPEPFLYKCKRFLYGFVGLANKRYGLICTKNISLFKPKILQQDELDSLLQSYDVVLPQARKLKYTVKEHYRRYHDINDLKVLEAILEEKYPDYLEAFHSVLTGKKLYANNMFILKDEHYQGFMAWWFEMLFEFERRVDIRQYQGYQKRIMGFIAERLLTVWFKKQQLRCKELQLIYFKNLKYE